MTAVVAVLAVCLALEAFFSGSELALLSADRIRLRELFGKAGGGPGCATLYMPADLELPEDAPIRYSVRRDEMRAYRERVPEKLRVTPEFFEGKRRG